MDRVACPSIYITCIRLLQQPNKLGFDSVQSVDHDRYDLIRLNQRARLQDFS
jgi:hypothetical protein